MVRLRITVLCQSRGEPANEESSKRSSRLSRSKRFERLELFERIERLLRHKSIAFASEG